ncbi:MAG: hypothetical protein Q7T05_04690, partial [Dehalococcoidia bacterium]|nr:hypothetical protein [Dehalococcoidia bacterium]
KLIMARRKPIDTISLSELGLAQAVALLSPDFRVTEVFSPRSARQTEFLSGNPDEIARRAALIIRETSARKS